MRRVVCLLACALTLAALLPLNVLAQGRGSVSGRVTTSTGEPVTGAQVGLRGTGLRAFTSASGNFVIVAVPPGSYTVVVQSLGYRAASEVVTVAAGAAADVDFMLEAEPVALAPLAIVGSRARHTAADELAVPVDVFTAEQIRLAGTTETSQILAELTPSLNFFRHSVSDATEIVRPFILRGLSPDHTLVLVNGKRRHKTAVVHVFGAGMGAGSSGVDMNALPASAIEQVEVLRDGAAAQYGSDAIAGVVNVRLKEGAFDPFFSVDVGQYRPGAYDFPADGEILDVAGGWGMPLGLGSIALFAEYRNREKTNRAWPEPFDQVVEGDADEVVDGQIVSKNNDVPQPNYHWGDGASEDILLFANTKFPLNAEATAALYAFGGYSFRNGTGNGFRRNGNDDRNWPAVYPLGFLPEFNPDVVDITAAGGVRGSVSSWSYDLGATYGFNSFDFDLRNTLNTSLGPCVNTTPCAPGLDGVLGTTDDPGIPNQTSFFSGALELDELVFNLDLSRSLDLGLSSPVSFALGALFRRETYTLTQGERASWVQGYHPDRNGNVAPPGSQVFPGFRPEDEADADRTNFGVYAEAETDLARGVLANVAGRFEDYSDFGNKLTGKLALRFQPSERLTLRGAVSTGFRAPSLSQSWYQSIGTNFAPDPITGIPEPFEFGIFRVNHDAAEALGAESLKEETSLNASAGFAITPAENFNLAVDAFFIDLDDRIVMTTELSGEEVEAVLRSSGEPSVVAVRYMTNAIHTETKGVDVTASYRFPLAEVGTLDLSGYYNYTDNKVFDDEIPTPPELQGKDVALFDYAFEGGLLAMTKERPRWRGGFSALFTGARLSLTGKAHLYGPYRSTLYSYDAGAEQKFGEEVLFDAEIGYRLPRGVKLAIGAKNLFDNYPDLLNEDNGFLVFPYPPASPFGYNGRYVYARAEVRFGR